MPINRQPIVNGDNGSWGKILNDYLLQISPKTNGGLNYGVSDPVLSPVTLTSFGTNDIGYTYINSQTNKIRRWDGSVWTTILESKLDIITDITDPSKSPSTNTNLGVNDTGLLYINKNTNQIKRWNGTAWEVVLEVPQVTTKPQIVVDIIDPTKTPGTNNNLGIIDTGLLYINKTTNQIKRWSGVAWEVVHTNSSLDTNQYYTYPNTSTITPVVVAKQDTYIGRVLKDISRFRSWAGNETNILIGELGVHNLRPQEEAKKWQKLLDSVCALALGERIPVFHWAVGHYWPDTYKLQPYRKVNNIWQNTYSSQIVNKYAHGTGNGLNYAVLEFDGVGNDPSLIPSTTDVAYLRQQNTEYVRLPILASYLVSWSNTSTLSSAGIVYADILFQTLNRFQKVGIKVMLDSHDYGHFKQSGVGTIDNSTIIGLTTRTKWHNYYKTLMNIEGMDCDQNYIKLKNHPALFMFDIMNEPYTLTPQSWEVESQAIVDVLRAEGFNKEIAVAVAGYCDLRECVNNHPNGPWIVDKLDGKIWYDGHIYFDYTSNTAGQYDNGGDDTYDKELLQCAGYQDFAAYSNNKATSSAKLLSKQDFILSGQNIIQNITVTPFTTKLIVIVATSTDLAPSDAVKYGSTNMGYAGGAKNVNSNGIYIHFYELDNPIVGTNTLSIDAITAKNFSVQIQCWLGLKTGNIAKNTVLADNHRSTGGNFDFYTKIPGSISVCAFSRIDDTNQNYTKGRPINNPTVEIGFINNGGIANRTNLLTEYRQNSEPSVFSINKILNNVPGDKYTFVSVEFPSDTYTIVPPTSVI
jgi:Cellulase (glycosyl hydrolase family 5)